MNRRELLKRCGGGLAAGLVLPPWLSACSNADEPAPAIDYDGKIAIIGAGAAGLHAGDILHSQGIDVVIFEASARPCGRVQSLRPATQPSSSLLFDPDNLLNHDFPLELGAEKIYGSDSAWGSLIEKMNVPVQAVRSVAAGDRFLLDNALRPESELGADAGFLAAKSFLSVLKEYAGPDMPLSAFVEGAGMDTQWQAILNSWLGNRWGTSNSRLSTRAMGEAWQLQMHNDTLQVAASNPLESVLLSRFTKVIPKVVVNAPVTLVEYSGDLIAITDQSNQTTVVNKVIVTVPVSVLKSGDMLFTPALPAAKQDALTRLHMDASVRVALAFKKNLWGRDTAFLFGGTVAPEYFSSGAGRSEFNQFLNITVNGPAAEKLSAQGSTMAQTIVDELDTVLNGEASANVLRKKDGSIVSVIRDWTKEPWIRGGMSYASPGGSHNDRKALAAPVDDRIFFAGEATDVNGDFGTVSGALQSAERAAKEVVDSILAG